MATLCDESLLNRKGRGIAPRPLLPDEVVLISNPPR